MPTSQKKLVLVRHAKAEHAPSKTDIDRALTPEGRKQSEALGDWLKETDALGQAVICSPSLRTRETWAGVVEATAQGVSIEFDKRIYEASPDDLLGVLREVSPDVTSLVMVGHAPGIPMLASLLSDGEGNDDAIAQLNRGFSPASVAVLTFEGPWSDLAFGSAWLDRVKDGHAFLPTLDS